MTTLTRLLHGTIAHPIDLATVADRAVSLAEGARAKATRRAYRSDWVHFERWGLMSIELSSLR